MTSLQQNLVFAVAQDFLDHLSLYQDTIQEQISSIVYMTIKKSLTEKNKKIEDALKGGVD